MDTNTGTDFTSGIEYYKQRNLNTTSIITCPFCGADIYIFLDYQGQVFCWQCGKEIIR
jgi:ribosomal protein S27E